MAGETALKNLQNILEEIIKFKSEAGHERTINVLNSEIVKIESEIGKIKAAAARAETKPTRTCVTLQEHGFDESDKFVKIFIPHNCTGITDENVLFELTDDSFSIIIKGTDKDYQFKVVNLLKPIDQAKSYKKVKTDMVSVYLKKVNEQKWGVLTVTEKRLKDVKTAVLEEDKDETSNDSMGGLMNMMKKMYDSGDPEMKRTIAKAWTEGQAGKSKTPRM